MVPRAHRLSAQKDVERVSRRGRPVFVRLLTVRALPNHLPVTRATAVAGLKVSKRSVLRNRAKRLIREAFRREMLPHARPGFDVVIHAKPDIVGKTYHEVADDLGRAMGKAGLLNKN